MDTSYHLHLVTSMVRLFGASGSQKKIKNSFFATWHKTICRNLLSHQATHFGFGGRFAACGVGTMLKIRCPGFLFIDFVILILAVNDNFSKAALARLDPFIASGLCFLSCRRLERCPRSRQRFLPLTRSGWQLSYSNNDSVFNDDYLKDSAVVDSGVDHRESRILTIRSENLAGMRGSNPNEEISFHLENDKNLVAITGETGSGKSLLIAKATKFLTGGKAVASLIPNTESSHSDDGGARVKVEMEIQLNESHVSSLRGAMRNSGLDSTLFFDEHAAPQQGSTKLTLKRTLSRTSSGSSSRIPSRLKSTCEINGRRVTLKALRAIAGPLLTVVEAATAANALARPESLMGILDTAVSPTILNRVWESRTKYRKSRKLREKLEQELSSHDSVLLSSSSGSQQQNGDEEQLDLLRHWVKELDAFEARATAFCETLLSSPDGSSSSTTTTSSGLESARLALAGASWMDIPSEESPSSSSLYDDLVKFRNVLRKLEEQILAAQNALGVLSALNSPESAVTAVERARNFLFDATAGVDDAGPGRKSKLVSAAEQSHDLLNAVEEALSACAKNLEDEDSGLIGVARSARESCPVSLDDIDTFLSDWNTLARKHGQSPFALPSCHRALRNELNGNVQARQLLPKAISEEEEALEEFEEACVACTEARQLVARRLSDSVTGRLPSLGMETLTFQAQVSRKRDCTAASVYSSGSVLGVDTVDFLLLHGGGETTSTTKNNNNRPKIIGSRRGGKISEVASSGEKARILLAIECELPGSVGASCGDSSLASDHHRSLLSSSSVAVDNAPPPPVAVIYDEIDAHLGGRAAVSMADMLVKQSEMGQVFVITHSPSVAANADMHIVIQKTDNEDDDGGAPKEKNRILTSTVEGEDRLKELARMASGDMAMQEAGIFAGALLREGITRRRNSLK